MALLRPTPWVSQPQVAAEIDWSNPITRGLIVAIQSSNGFSDLFSQSGINFGVTSQVSSGGIVGYFGGASNYSLGRAAFQNLTSGTVFFRARSDAFNSAHVVYESAPGFNNLAVKLPANASSPVVVNIGNNNERYGTKSSWNTGQWYSFAVTWDATTTAIYVDGVLDAAFSITSSTSASNQNTSIGSYDLGGKGQYLTGAMSNVTGFNRALSAIEIKSLSANPWQIFKPIPRRIFVPVSAGGGGTTITTNLGTATASGLTATLTQASTLIATQGTATASGLSATLAQAFNLSANRGTATASGNQATVAQAATISASLGTATASGYTASVSSAGNVTISANLGAATASGNQANIGANVTVSASLGAASAAGYTAALELAYTLAANLGTASATGSQATIYANESIACAIGAALATGYSATVTSTAQLTDSEKIDLILDILSNRQTLDPVSHIYTLFADDGVTVLKTALAWEDAAGTIPYKGMALQRLDEMQ